MSCSRSQSRRKLAIVIRTVQRLHGGQRSYREAIAKPSRSRKFELDPAGIRETFQANRLFVVAKILKEKSKPHGAPCLLHESAGVFYFIDVDRSGAVVSPSALSFEARSSLVLTVGMDGFAVFRHCIQTKGLRSHSYSSHSYSLTWDKLHPTHEFWHHTGTRPRSRTLKLVRVSLESFIAARGTL